MDIQKINLHATVTNSWANEIQCKCRMNIQWVLHVDGKEVIADDGYK